MRAAAALLLVPLVTAIPATAAAQNPLPEDPLRHELDELRGRVHELEQRLAESESREARAPASIALAPPPPSPPSPPSPSFRFRFERDGFSFGTADRSTEIRLRGILQLDGRVFIGATEPIADTFLIRRARPFIDGTLFGIVEFRLMAELGPGQPLLQDGYVDLRPWRWLSLRGGKFRVPIGLEWMQNDTQMPLPERSLASNLVPWRDVGAMLSGELGGGTFVYALGIVNGAADHADGPDLDKETAKDYFGRLFFHPLRPTHHGAFTNLGLGVAGSYGCATGTAAAPALPIYRSTGFQPIFSYLADATTADGTVLPACDRWRVAPQMYWFLGPVGLFGEYVYSSHRVERGGAVATLNHQAWNVRASFVVTLEHVTYEGVVPKRPVDFRHKRFGALELAMRYSELRLDEHTFPTYADPAKSVRLARELAAGATWYMTENIKIMVSYHRTDYAGGAPLGGDREPENTLITRLQLAY
jgi:phosphate-selective porin OprO/OprP